MDTISEIGSYTYYSLGESWQRNLTVLNDVPLSAEYWHLSEITGEKLLDELPELQINIVQLKTYRN
jgi:hypothetical protein